METSTAVLGEDISKTFTPNQNVQVNVIPPPPPPRRSFESQPEEKVDNGLSEKSPTSPALPPRRSMEKQPQEEDEKSKEEEEQAASPRLPPRKVSIERKYNVPPPLEEEMRSDTFRKNLAMTQADTKHVRGHGRESKRKQAVLDSAAEINLIVNRFRVTSHHIEEEGETTRENLAEGQNLLKSSFTTILEGITKISEDVTAEETPLETEGGKEVASLEELDEEEKKMANVDWTFWSKVVNDFPTVAKNEADKLETIVTEGIPPQIRGIIWQLISNSKSKEMEDIYLTLLDTPSTHDANIRRDLKRTNFIPSEKVESLFNVIKVYSVYDPDVGYTQGMAFIATPLIVNTKTEAEVFSLLIGLMKNYGLRDFFLPDMPGLMLMLYQFDRLLEENSPQLFNHLTREGIRSSMYATQWFLTFFAYKFPFEFVLRIFDIVFVEGIEAVLKFAVVLMLNNKEKIINLKFDQLLNFLKNELFIYYLKESVESREGGKSVIDKTLNTESLTAVSSNTQLNQMNSNEDKDYDVDLFVHDAMNKVYITPISLKRYAAEYDEIEQLEHQKEAQYESFRIKNYQLQRESKKLERDYGILNKEHIAIANELIENRLKAEMLLDENNDLKQNLDDAKAQLDEELRKRDLPNPDAALPSDLKQDLDRTMQRNQEVMEENRVLQDRIIELETEVEELKRINRLKASRKSTDRQRATPSTPTPSPQKEPRAGVKSPIGGGWSGFKKVFTK